MLTEFKLCITALILLIVFSGVFVVLTVGKEVGKTDTLDGVVALLIVVCAVVFVVSGIAGVWQL